MSISAIIMLIFGCIVLFGGLILCILRIGKKSNENK